MNKHRHFILRILLPLFSVFTFLPYTFSQDCSKLVNPFVGTDFTGNTYPGAQLPFGMVQLSPDNGLPGWDRISGYFYPDSTIAGFSHTHLSGTGAGDLYDISFMPVTLPYREAESPLGIYSKFSHSSESASAGYYKVLLSDYNIKVELTATERCGIQKYTFPKSDAAVFLNLRKAMNWDFTLDNCVRVLDDRTIEGYRFSRGWSPDQKVYFRTRFSKPFKSYSIDSLPVTDEGKRIGTSIIARFDFDTDEGEEVTVITALSGVSMEGAGKNMAAEAPTDDFDYYRKNAAEVWNRALGKIQIKSDDKVAKRVFYTALYHSMLAPTLYCDVNGDYRGADKKIHHAAWKNYSTFSLWDTYRASHPLFTCLCPQRVNDMVHSFLAFYHQHGRLPVWNFYGCETNMMIGYHSVPVIVDAFLKGIGDFDAKEALKACVAAANSKDFRQMSAYIQHGYVPYNSIKEGEGENWSMSKTLEYAFDDYCIAVMAEHLGETEIAREFYKRAQNYQKIYNPATSFFQPKDSEGTFLPNFSPDDYSAYICESNAWQYMFSVQHDMEGLIKLLGGKERTIEKLDSLFTYHPEDRSKLPLFSTGMIGQYVHGNEPDHHVPYLYNKVGQPWKTQYYARKIMEEFYKDSPDGLCGNEDCGQMSAWYVWSAMGLYPVNPVSGQYEIGAPLFPSVKLALPDGKVFRVVAHHVSHRNKYVQSVKLNGRPYHKSFITHKDIMDSSLLEFEMGSKPGSVWY